MTTMNKASFLRQYQQELENGELKTDPEQNIVAAKMQTAFEQIQDDYNLRFSFNINSMLPFSKDKPRAEVLGIYLWGGVGRGKTLLLDMFYECLPFEKKQRLHFHRFMQSIHESIEKLSGVDQPINHIAKDMAKKYHVICLDEVVVIDITDAMILAELFNHLTENKVVLLFTSNIAPCELYKDGLQRARFIPAIELIEKSSHVIELKGDNDYRLDALEHSKLYQLNSDPNSERNIESLFQMMSNVLSDKESDDLIINYRRLEVKRWESGVIWFNFDQLCNTHRDSSDYIRLATYFNTIMISDVYILDAEKDDVARRFINMIDVFYDRHINIVISAAVFPDKLYTGKRLKREFSRTISRLNEMQTVAYLAKSKCYKEMLEKPLIDIDLNFVDSSSDINNSTRFGDWVNNGRCTDF